MFSFFLYPYLLLLFFSSTSAFVDIEKWSIWLWKWKCSYNKSIILPICFFDKDGSFLYCIFHPLLASTNLRFKYYNLQHTFHLWVAKRHKIQIEVMVKLLENAVRRVSGCTAIALPLVLLTTGTISKAKPCWWTAEKVWCKVEMELLWSIKISRCSLPKGIVSPSNPSLMMD